MENKEENEGPRFGIAFVIPFDATSEKDVYNIWPPKRLELSFVSCTTKEHAIKGYRWSTQEHPKRILRIELVYHRCISQPRRGSFMWFLYGVKRDKESSTSEDDRVWNMCIMPKEVVEHKDAAEKLSLLRLISICEGEL